MVVLCTAKGIGILCCINLIRTEFTNSSLNQSNTFDIVNLYSLMLRSYHNSFISIKGFLNRIEAKLILKDS